MQTHPNADAAVGQEIRRHRRQAGLTLAEVASRIGVTGPQFHRYETGAARITTSRLVAIAKALNMRAETLLMAACNVEPKPLPMPASTSQEIIDLVQMFGSIADSQQRSALVAVARMMLSAPHRPTQTEAVAGM
jgi:transcriptional regulator with XRE-family HTH domain